MAFRGLSTRNTLIVLILTLLGKYPRIDVITTIKSMIF